MIKKIAIIGIIVLFVCGCHSSKPKQAGKVIASVGDGTLTLEQLVDAIPPSIQSKISKEQVNNYLQQWAEMELIYRDALRLGMDENENFLSKLEQARRELLFQQYVDKYLSENETVTDEEALGYYNDNKDNYQIEDDEIRALQIFVASSAEANNAYQRISRGEDFEAVAREVSIDFIDNQRIDLGYFNKDEIVPDLSNRIFNASVGTLTRPMQSEFGYHIFKIIDRHERGRIKEFEEVKDQIVARLKSVKRNEKYTDLILKLRNKTNYNFNIEPLKEFFKDSTYQLSSEIANKSH